VSIEREQNMRALDEQSPLERLQSQKMKLRLRDGEGKIKDVTEHNLRF
jgi:hypothetical protein